MIIDTLIAKLAANRKALKCPRCREPQAKPPGVPANGVMHCEACGYRASLVEWAMAMREGGSNAEEADPDQPPAGTMIARREPAPGAVEWRVPAPGRIGCLVLFSIPWLGITALLTVSAMMGTLESDDGEVWSRGGALLFLTPFWLLGIGLLYGGLRQAYARHVIEVTGGQVILHRILFSRRKRIALEKSAVTTVSMKEFYRQNYQPVYGIEIRGTGGKIRFGSTMSDAEKRWLAADLRRTILPPTLPEVTARAPVNAKSDRRPAERFEIEMPDTRKKGTIWATLAILGILLIGNYFVWSDDFFPSSNAPNWFRPLVLGSLILYSALASWYLIYRIRTKDERLRVGANTDEVWVAKTERGQALSEERLPRRGIAVRSYAVGSSSGDPRLRIELVGEHRALPLARFCEETEEIRAFIADLRQRLGG
ncbi:MAG: hypothetical protein R3F11_29000 [Verrucomicrobiales bacterium]